MSKNLVIVESPTKAKTIGRFLGDDFRVASSYGHIRDLPAKEMGIDIENGFEPHYVVPSKSKKIVTELKKLLEESENIYYATDQDREGEAIAWHLNEILKPDPKKTRRITFHEITKNAILDAIKNPRAIDARLVDSQQARRVLDRLVGYELSPFLWRKIAKGLSAGRVQSVAVRLIVEREREIEAFKSQEFWTIETLFVTLKKEKFTGELYKIKDKALEKFDIPTAPEAEKILENLKNRNYKISHVESKKSNRTPPAPFTTSTIQQDANRSLGFSAKQTMRLAQNLYEVGHITYMRTDSVNLSDKFLGEAGDLIKKEFGAKYYSGPKKYITKSKTAQEAHEAIRPTEAWTTPQDLKTNLEPYALRLYDLIWRRAVASQMAKAEIETMTIEIRSSNDYYFKSTGSVVKFDGWLKVYPDKIKENLLPTLKKGESVEAEKIDPIQHFTQPPPRYTEASLVKTLEEYGIGRPSTYAPTISTIMERGYVNKDGKALLPTDIAKLVNDMLVKHFNDIVNLEFTALMEDHLDDIAVGKAQWVPTIRTFYEPFKENLTKKDAEVKKEELIEESDEKCEKCGKPMVIRWGKYGKFLACTGFPSCKTTKNLNGNEPVSTNIKCPQCKEGDILEKKSRKGKTFYSCSRWPDCDYALSPKKAYVLLGIGKDNKIEESEG